MMPCSKEVIIMVIIMKRIIRIMRTIKGVDSPLTDAQTQVHVSRHAS